MIIFNIEKSSTTFRYKNEIFMKISFFPFYMFYSQKTKSNFEKRVAGAYFQRSFQDFFIILTQTGPLKVVVVLIQRVSFFNFYHNIIYSNYQRNNICDRKVHCLQGKNLLEIIIYQIDIDIVARRTSHFRFSPIFYLILMFNVSFHSLNIILRPIQAYIMK